MVKCALHCCHWLYFLHVEKCQMNNAHESCENKNEAKMRLSSNEMLATSLHRDYLYDLFIVFQHS